MSGESCHALVLRVFDYSETSQIMHLLTRELGRVHGIAKGARRLKGSFHGGADVLTAGEMQILARKGTAELRTLASWDCTEPFAGLRASLPRFHAANDVAAVLLAFCREEQPHPELFELAIGALSLLADADDAAAPALALGFEAMALTLLGFAPELDRCVVCGKPAKNVRTTRLSPAKGGLLCTPCRGEDPRAAPIDAAGLVALRALSHGPLVDAPHHLASPGTKGGVRDALDAWTTTLLDRPLRR